MTEGEMGRMEREALLERAKRPSTLIGAEIPASIKLGGEIVPLRSLVLSLLSAPPGDESAVSDARRLAQVLEREAGTLAESVRRDPDLTRQKAEALARDIIGLRRAASDLRSVGRKKSFGQATVEESQVEDARRWVEFLKALR